MQKVHIEKIEETMSRYFFEKVAPAADGIAAFALGAGYAFFAKRIIQAMKDMGLCDEENKVDVETLDKVVASGFKASNGKASMSYFGHKFTFSPEDWREFRAMLLR